MVTEDADLHCQQAIQQAVQRSPDPNLAQVAVDLSEDMTSVDNAPSAS